jgi:thiol:disulfide interchange protein DsbD
VIIATVIIGGIYLGFLESSGKGVKTFTRIKWGVGMAMLVLGVMMLMNLQKEGIEWETYTDESYTEAIENNQAVMMDFYADWCIPCLELERSTFVDENVINATQNFRRFKVDMTNYESESSQQLRETFEVAGVPTIVFIGPDGEEIENARVVGFLNANSFMERVNMLRDVSNSGEVAQVE